MRTGRVRPFTALLALAWVVVAAPARSQDRLTEALDRYLGEVVEQTHVPGLVAMVADGERVLYAGAFGAQNVAAGTPMAVDTIFRIASMTKPVTSAAVMMLVEEGKIGLDDPASRYLSELGDKKVIDEFDAATKRYTTRPAERPVTIRHLLTNTSGLAYAFSNERLFVLTEGQQNASAMSFPLVHDPGERWTYGESTRALGRILEQVSGQPLDEFLRERIFEPLGMTDTFYSVPAEKRRRVATVHRMTEQGLVETPNPEDISSPALGDGGLHSTAADYVKFVQWLLNEGRAPDGRQLLRPETVRLMGQNHTGEVRVERQPSMVPAVSEPFPLGAGRDTFGLGFQITGEPREPGMRAPGSMSWAGIFNTEFWIDPAGGVGAVLLMQYLPFYDATAIETLQGFERRIYEHLN